jgi:ubiquinone/menaquinone biosynthesis C-methylase UbiE
MAASAAFWNRMAKGYAKSPISDIPSYEKKLAITRGYLKPDMDLLEIGCGTGGTALAHAPHVKHIRAVDISEKMLAFAREKKAEAGAENVTFECSAIDALALEDRAYDMVLALSILHLVEGRTDVMARVYRTLRPGGLFVTSTICLADGYGHLKYLLPPLRWVGLVPYLEFFTEDQLKAEFLATGFTPEAHFRPGPKKASFMVMRKPA